VAGLDVHELDLTSGGCNEGDPALGKARNINRAPKPALPWRRAAATPAVPAEVIVVIGRAAALVGVRGAQEFKVQVHGHGNVIVRALKEELSLIPRKLQNFDQDANRRSFVLLRNHGATVVQPEFCKNVG
jgi:hypothetical protein